MNDAVKLLTQAIQLICDDEEKKKANHSEKDRLRERVLLLDNMIKKISNDHDIEMKRMTMSINTAYAIISDMVKDIPKG